MQVLVFDDDVEQALKVLKRKVAKEGLGRDIRRHRFFVSKPERRREKDASAAKRKRKNLIRNRNTHHKQ